MTPPIELSGNAERAPYCSGRVQRCFSSTNIASGMPCDESPGDCNLMQAVTLRKSLHGRCTTTRNGRGGIPAMPARSDPDRIADHGLTVHETAGLVRLRSPETIRHWCCTIDGLATRVSHQFEWRINSLAATVAMTLANGTSAGDFA
jgi:hypothetical protein